MIRQPQDVIDGIRLTIMNLSLTVTVPNDTPDSEILDEIPAIESVIGSGLAYAQSLFNSTRDRYHKARFLIEVRARD
jgi:hypothetical protein